MYLVGNRNMITMFLFSIRCFLSGLHIAPDDRGIGYGWFEEFLRVEYAGLSDWSPIPGIRKIT